MQRRFLLRMTECVCTVRVSVMSAGAVVHGFLWNDQLLHAAGEPERRHRGDGEQHVSGVVEGQRDGVGGECVQL